MIFPREVIEGLLNNSRLDHKGENLYSDCPFCGGNEYGISLGENHLFRCFRGNNCGETGNIYTLLKHLDKMELLGDSDYYRETDIFSTLEKRSLSPEKEEIDVSLDDIKSPVGWKRIKSLPYLTGRGFTDTQFIKYEIGQTKLFRKFKGFVIFLIRQDGFIKGYVARNTKGKNEIDTLNKGIKKRNAGKDREDKEPVVLRYSNSVDADFSKILYGIDEAVAGVTNAVIVVEGLFDKINLEIIAPDLFESKEIIVCCTWGKKISKFQISKMEENNIEKAILLYDPDAINDSKRYAFELGNYIKDVQVGFLKDKDPGDLNTLEFIDVMENLSDPQKFSLDKLQKRDIF